MDSPSHVVRERFTFLDFYSVHDDSDDSGDIARSLRRRSSSLPAAVTRGRDVDLAAKQQEFLPARGVGQYTSVLPESSARRLDETHAFDEDNREVDAEDVDGTAIKSPTPSEYCDNSSTKATSEASQELASGYEHITSVMIRNIPCSFTKKRFIDLLVDYGFSGTFDFVHLPGYRNKRRGNIGYGFVNFIDRKYADAATELITGHRFSGTLSKKVAIVSPAVKNLCGKWSGGSAPVVADTSSASIPTAHSQRQAACAPFGQLGNAPNRLIPTAFVENTCRNMSSSPSGSYPEAPRCSDLMGSIDCQAHSYMSTQPNMSSMPTWCLGAQDGRHSQPTERWCSGTSAGGKKKPSSSRREQRKHHNYQKSVSVRENENKD